MKLTTQYSLVQRLGMGGGIVHSAIRLDLIREGVGYVKTQLPCILLYYADDDNLA